MEVDVLDLMGPRTLLVMVVRDGQYKHTPVVRPASITTPRASLRRAAIRPRDHKVRNASLDAMVWNGVAYD